MNASPPGSSSDRDYVSIEAMGSQGDGVAPGPLHVPLTLPGERVLVRRDGARAEALEIAAPSPDRTLPPCPHFGDCGGCALQHWARAPYLTWKADMVRQALARERIETEILPTYASPPASRRRVALHARRGGGGALLGFKARRSWRLVDIAVCPIADPRIVAALPALRRLAFPFLEHPKSAPTLHVTVTIEGLDVDVTGVEAKSGGLSADARLRAAQAAGEGPFTRVTLAGETVFQAAVPTVRLGPAVVALPPGAFLQAVPQAEEAMSAFMLDAIAGAKSVADLYCGVGTFTFRLAQTASVHAADAAPQAIRALQAAIAGVPGLKPIHAEARDLDRRPVLADELRKTDAVVFDPPRAGAAPQCVQLARSKVGRVVGVSCNPSTFARDARTLVNAGFRLDRVLPVDQFIWSPHIELVAVFSR